MTLEDAYSYGGGWQSTAMLVLAAQGYLPPGPFLLATVGSDEATVSITVSGHANPGHGKYEGWADEMLNVQISATEPVPAEPAPTE